MENLTQGQLDKMTKNELVSHIEQAQKAILAVENNADASQEQKDEADKKFSILQRAKNAVIAGANYVYNGIKRVYIPVKTFISRLAYRVKGFLATCWSWLKGLGHIVIGACVNALRALGSFLGHIIGKTVTGMQDALDRGVRIFVPAKEDDVEAVQREALAETKRLNRPDLEARCEAATESMEASAAAGAKAVA